MEQFSDGNRLFLVDLRLIIPSMCHRVRSHHRVGEGLF